MGSMEFPEQEWFTVEDLAQRWSKSKTLIDELVRKRAFTHFKVEGERIGERFIKRHIYCYRDAWPPGYGEGDHYFIDGNVDEIATRPPIPPTKRPGQARMPKGSNLWEQPSGTTIFIPRAAVKTFEQKRGIQNEPNAQKGKREDKCPAPDLSEIQLDKWYTTSSAARYLDMTTKYLQNDLIPNGKLKAQKRGRRNKVQGQEILNYAKKYPSTS
jgi:hypothetical protein